MPNCRACGTRIGCESDAGTYIKETGEWVCDGCYDPSCNEDLDEHDMEVAKGQKRQADAALHHWEHRRDDAYDETDRTARLTDIGGVEDD